MIIDRPCTTCGFSLEKGVKIVAFVDIVLGSIIIVLCSTILAHWDDITGTTRPNQNETPLMLNETEGNETSPLSFGMENFETEMNCTTQLELNQTESDNMTSTDYNDCGSSGIVDTNINAAAGSSKTNKNATGKTMNVMEEYYDYTFENVVLIIVLVFAVIQVLIVQLLYLGLYRKETTPLYIWLVISGFSIPATGFLIKMYEMIVVFAYSEELKGELHGEALEKFRKLPFVCNIETQLYPFPRLFGRKRRKVKAEEKEGEVDVLSIENEENGKSGRNNSMTHFQKKSFVMNAPGSLFSVVQHS